MQLCRFIDLNAVDTEAPPEEELPVAKATILKSSQKVNQPEMLCERLVTLPKNHELLSLKLMLRMPINYIDDGCVVSFQMLARLAMELGSEWLELGKALGLSPVVLHIIENNAIHSNCTELEKRVDMLLNWNKTELRSSNKIETLSAALNRVGRSDLEDIMMSEEVAKGIFNTIMDTSESKGFP